MCLYLARKEYFPEARNSFYFLEKKAVYLYVAGGDYGIDYFDLIRRKRIREHRDHNIDLFEHGYHLLVLL